MMSDDEKQENDVEGQNQNREKPMLNTFLQHMDRMPEIPTWEEVL